MTKEDTLTGILQKSVETLNCSAGIVALWHDLEGYFVEEAACGLDSAGITRLRPVMQELISKLDYEEQHIYRLSDLVPGIHAPEDIQNQESQELILAFPITLEKGEIGVIAVLRSASSEMFTTEDQKLLSIFADQAALSIQNSHLASQLSEAQFKLNTVSQNSGDEIHGLDHQREVEDITSTLLATVSHE
ncbi:MAG: GAF domain-containing protein, partial [Dehalococcoidia bacterium]